MAHSMSAFLNTAWCRTGITSTIETTVTTATNSVSIISIRINQPLYVKHAPIEAKKRLPLGCASAAGPVTLKRRRFARNMISTEVFLPPPSSVLGEITASPALCAKCSASSTVCGVTSTGRRRDVATFCTTLTREYDSSGLYVFVECTNSLKM